MSNYKKTGLAILCILSIIGIIFCRLHVHDRWIEMTPPKPSDEEIQRLIKCVVNDGDIDSYNDERYKFTGKERDWESGLQC